MIKKILNKIFKQNIQSKQKIIIFCGAGISAESGLNTFRDNNGLWQKHKLEDVCNLKTFKNNKNLVFDFYNERKQEILNSNFNTAHQTIANIQSQFGQENVTIFTSNIDNLLEKAGCKNVCHIHGNIFEIKCLNCDSIFNIGNDLYDVNLTCSHCKSNMIKPNIVFFNEQAPEYPKLQMAFEHAGEIIDKTLIPNIKLIVGTSFNVLKPYIFYPHRGYTILVDKKPNLGSYEDEFYSIISEPATKGLLEAKTLIEQIYLK